MLNLRSRKNDARYVDWIRTWDISIPMLGRIDGKWKLVPKKFHFEKEFKAMPIEESNIYSKKWHSKRGNAEFEIVLGRREHNQRRGMRTRIGTAVHIEIGEQTDKIIGKIK